MRRQVLVAGLVAATAACGGEQSGAGGADSSDGLDETRVAGDLDAGEGACPAPLVRWPGGACAPRIDSCADDELPLVGGGCVRVGPDLASIPALEDFDGLVPFFDECPAWKLALAGGGCKTVGPRACPLEWVPESDVACEPGELRPCPEGWAESEDGLSCLPSFEACGPAEIASLSGGCHPVLTPSTECPEGPFPPAPDEGKPTAYVSASSLCLEGCGSPEQPFPGLTAALASLPAGGVVLVGPGTYDEGLSLAAPVTIVGLCASQCIVTGAVAATPEGENLPTTAGVAIESAGAVELSGLTIATAAAGLVVTGPSQVKVNEVEIVGSTAIGVYAGAGAEVTLEQVWLHDLSPVEGVAPEDHAGLYVAPGASLTLAGSLVESAVGAGLSVFGTGATGTVSGSTLRGGHCAGDGSGGYGVRAKDGATTALSSCIIEENREVGILVEGGSHVDAQGCVIRNTVPNDNGKRGYSLYALEGSSAQVTDSVLAGARKNNVAAKDAGTEVELIGCAVREVSTEGDGVLGFGLSVVLGAKASIVASLVEKSVTTGLNVSGQGTRLEAAGSLIRQTAPGKEPGVGAGLLVTEGASARAEDCVFDDHVTRGAAAGYQSSAMELVGCRVTNTKADEAQNSGVGVLATETAVVKVTGSLVERNQSSGLFVSTAGTKMEVSGTTVRDTLPDPAGRLGQGMQVDLGSQASVAGSLFEDNRTVGIAVLYPKSSLELADSVVRRTGTELVSETSGFGMYVRSGAAAHLTNCLLDGNTGAGAVAGDPDSVLLLAHSVIAGTKPLPDGHFGFGLQASTGSLADLSSCLLTGNTLAGINVAGEGATAVLTNTVVAETEAGLSLLDKAGYGYGLGAFAGGAVSATRSLFLRNHAAGIVTWDSGTEVQLERCEIRDTLAMADGSLGCGLVALDGSAISAVETLMRHNATSGAMAYDPGSIVTLDSCGVLGTTGGGRSGESPESFGDGLTAVAGAELHLGASWIDGNERAGVYYFESTGSLAGSILSNNGSYGLALAESAGVEWEAPDNYVFGNAGNLPPAYQAQVTTSPEGLPVPQLEGLAGRPEGNE